VHAANKDVSNLLTCRGFLALCETSPPLPSPRGRNIPYIFMTFSALSRPLTPSEALALGEFSRGIFSRAREAIIVANNAVNCRNGTSSACVSRYRN